MINMKSAPEGESSKEIAEYEEPQYPYGLCLHLGMDELEKLGITQLPEVGAVMMISAKAFVKSTSAYETQSDGKTMSVDLQITDMELGAEKKDPASVMFPQG